MPTPSEDPGLLKYLDEIVEKLRSLVTAAVNGQDVEAVHDARVATRRLKAATDVLDSILGGRTRKPFDKIMRALRRRLGPLRDLDVMLEHLGEIKIPKYSAAIEWLDKRLKELREKAVGKARKKAPPARVLSKINAWWIVRQDVIAHAEAIDHLLSQSIHLQLDGFAEQMTGDPHALRITGKALRYTLEMAREHGHRVPRKITSIFKHMQEALGIWHDYVVLTERMLCETVDCDLALHHPELQSQVLSLAQWTLKKAQLQLAKMHALWKSRGQELTTQIRQAFLLTEIITPQSSPAQQAPPTEPVVGT